jgi:hypothetical protein
MSTLTPPGSFTPAPDGSSRLSRPSSSGRHWSAGAIAIIGLTIGITTSRNFHSHVDSFERASIPGIVAVQVDEPTTRVIYYEGDYTVRYDNLTIAVTNPAGTPVRVARHDGEAILDTLGLTRGRPMATFNATSPGTYQIALSGVDTGQFAVGDTLWHRTAPETLARIVLGGLSIAAAFALWHLTLIRRRPASATRERTGDREGSVHAPTTRRNSSRRPGHGLHYLAETTGIPDQPWPRGLVYPFALPRPFAGSSRLPQRSSGQICVALAAAR